MPAPKSRLPLRLPLPPTVRVSFELLRVMLSTAVTPPVMAVTELRVLLPLRVTETVEP